MKRIYRLKRNHIFHSDVVNMLMDLDQDFTWEYNSSYVDHQLWLYSRTYMWVELVINLEDHQNYQVLIDYSYKEASIERFIDLIFMLNPNFVFQIDELVRKVVKYPG